MTTSPATSFLLGIRKGEPIAEDALVYVAARAKARAYNFILSKFLEKAADTELFRADLARMLSMQPAQVTRYLSSPQNWTIETMAKMLLAIEQAELAFQSIPVEHAVGKTNSGFGWDHGVRAEFFEEPEDDKGIDPGSQESTGSLKLRQDAAA